MSECTVSALVLTCQQGPSQATQAFLGSTRWPLAVGHGSLQISPEPWESVFSCPFHAAKPSGTLIPATLFPPLWKPTAHWSSFSGCLLPLYPRTVCFSCFHTSTGVLGR